MQAISGALLTKGLSPIDLRYVGSRRGQEAQLLGDSDIALTLLPGRGLRRSLRPKDIVINCGAALGLVSATFIALVHVRRWRASAVVSVGGYASFAVSMAAVLWRVPLILVELDATPTAAQRVVARWAAVRCSAFPSNEANVVVTGAPIRDAIEGIDRSREARNSAKLHYQPSLALERSVVVVMTGSLGSTRVNKAVSELAALWKDRSDLSIIHVTGRRDYQSIRDQEFVGGELQYQVIDFGDMVQLWALCDVAICRAGAMTMAELAALSIPSILVPLPGAPGDHQTKNARVFEAAGGALVLSDASCDVASLSEHLEKMLDSATRETMGRAAGSLAHHHAAAAIAAEVVTARRMS
jgi:UDP-N-acetylglucosamine:LPS N-acetylglucosamine transferase